MREKREREERWKEYRGKEVKKKKRGECSPSNMKSLESLCKRTRQGQ